MLKRFIIISFIFTVLICYFTLTSFANATDDEKLQITQTEESNITEFKCNNSTKQNQNMWIDTFLPVAVEFLGAFLGVLTALWLSSHTNRKQYKELNKSLYNELLTLKDDLNKRFDEKHDYYRYSTPVWDINLAAGNLSILANGHIDKEYIHIYSKIQYAQELEREYIHSKLIEKNGGNCFLKSYISSIDSARFREASEIKVLIDNLNKEVK